MVVVLPAPVSPRNPKIVPGAIVSERSQTASMSPYDLLRRSRRMAGSLMTFCAIQEGAWHKRLYILATAALWDRCAFFKMEMKSREGFRLQAVQKPMRVLSL